MLFKNNNYNVPLIIIEEMKKIIGEKYGKTKKD